MAIYLLFVMVPNKNRVGCQTDVTATSLTSVASIMATEAVEMSAATSVSREIANASSQFINLSGGQMLGIIIAQRVI